MNYNSRINWHAGLDFTESTLRTLSSLLDMRQRVAVRLAMGAGTCGIIPDTELSVNPAFVGKTIEITGMKMTALLPSGGIMHVDEDVVVNIDKEKIASLAPNPQEEKYKFYLTVALSDEMEVFEVNDQSFERPLCTFDFCTKEEAEQKDAIAIARLTVDDGSLTIDSDFIIPGITASAIPQLDEQWKYLHQQYAELAHHKNLETSDLKAFLMQQVCHTSANCIQQQTTSFIENVTQTISILLLYLESYMDSHKLTEDKKEIPALEPVSILDIDTYLITVRSIMDAVKASLDICIVEDHSIDYDQLKADLKAEILETIRPEMEEKMAAMRSEMHDEMIQVLEQRLHDAIDNMMEELRNQLSRELYDNLYQPLYNALYTALHTALYRPLPTTDNEYTPLI